MSLAHPVFLLLVPLVLLAAWWRMRQPSPAVRYSDVGLLPAQGGWRSHLTHLPHVLRLLCLLLLVIAVARPRDGLERRTDTREGIAIQLVLDRSSSMENEAIHKDGTRTPLFELARQAALNFVLGNDQDLPGRPDDAIGLIGFAGYPDTLCPLTHAHDVLAHFLKRMRTVTRPNEDGTAIGDAVALACARLTENMRQQQKQAEIPRDAAKSRVVILFTDGDNNRGRGTDEAAGYAEKRGVRLYVIAYVGPIRFFGQDHRGRRVHRDGTNRLNQAPLEEMARQTGGRFFAVRDPKDLAAVYREIDTLETTRMHTERDMVWRERFHPWALAALGTLLVEVLLSTLLLRKTP